jgi:hypothetical protein
MSLLHLFCYYKKLKVCNFILHNRQSKCDTDYDKGKIQIQLIKIVPLANSGEYILK